MELTAEQKYLKALAEWLDIETIPKNRIQEASREYLDQFVSVNEKVEPESAWTPELGKLYKSYSGQIVEFFEESDMFIGYDIITKRIPHYIPVGSFVTEQDASVFLGTIPIAELEGLKVGDYVYSELGEAWFIDNIDCEVITITGSGLIEIGSDGTIENVSDKQLFWRTADRAKRFGRGDA